MRDKIQEALEQLDSYVQYGNVRNRSDALPQLNYTVFCRKNAKVNQGRTDLTVYWEVSIVRENEVPMDEVERYLETLGAIPGLKVASDAIQFWAQYMDGTKCQLEAVALSFVESTKRRLS